MKKRDILSRLSLLIVYILFMQGYSTIPIIFKVDIPWEHNHLYLQYYLQLWSSFMLICKPLLLRYYYDHRDNNLLLLVFISIFTSKYLYFLTSNSFIYSERLSNVVMDRTVLVISWVFIIRFYWDDTSQLLLQLLHFPSQVTDPHHRQHSFSFLNGILALFILIIASLF